MCKYFIHCTKSLQRYKNIIESIPIYKASKSFLLQTSIHSFLPSLSHSFKSPTLELCGWEGNDKQLFLSSCQLHMKRIVLFRVDFEDESFDWSFFTIREQPSLNFEAINEAISDSLLCEGIIKVILWRTNIFTPVSYTHLTLPTTPYV